MWCGGTTLSLQENTAYSYSAAPPLSPVRHCARSKRPTQTNGALYAQALPPQRDVIFRWISYARYIPTVHKTTETRSLFVISVTRTQSRFSTASFRSFGFGEAENGRPSGGGKTATIERKCFIWRHLQGYAWNSSR